MGLFCNSIGYSIQYNSKIWNCAVCFYWVNQCYPGAIFHPRVTSGLLNLMYLWTLLFAHCNIFRDSSAIILDTVYTILAKSEIVLYVFIGLNSAILVQCSIHGWCRVYNSIGYCVQNISKIRGHIFWVSEVKGKKIQITTFLFTL